MQHGNSSKSKRSYVYIKLIKDMKEPTHKLHNLLPPLVNQIRERDTRLDENRFYNFKCRTQRFSNSPLVYMIRKYNFTIENS